MATSKKPLGAMKKLSGDPIVVKKPTAPTQAQLQAFGNYGGGLTDSKQKAAYLAKKGLIGASQLYTDHPDITNDKNMAIINAQSNWKEGAIGAMLRRARSLNLQTPTEIKANRTALLGSLRPELAKAINHPAFSQIHKNWWETFDSVLADQYAAENTTTPLLQTELAKK